MYYDEKKKTSPFDVPYMMLTRSKTKFEPELELSHKTTTSLQIPTTNNDSKIPSTIKIPIEDGDESRMYTGRTKEGRDELITSPKLAKKAVNNGIGKKRKINKVSLQVAFL